MLGRITAASLVVSAALAPLAVSAQSARTSPVDSFHLVQLSVKSAEVAPQEFKAKTEAIRSCTDAMNVREELGADMTRNRFVRASQLPGDLKAIVEELPVGQATPVYTYDGSTLRVLVLCNRT